tara:strand:+ start:3019 stop:3333 length:315 start_codon:yes stop_codon:yes gene_type:complete
MKKLIACGFLVLCMGCASEKQAPPPPLPPLPPQTPIVVPPKVKPVKPITPPRVFTAAYIRGYNDGYAGNWLAPINWTFINEYRAGWSAGKRDVRAGLPNKFETA